MGLKKADYEYSVRPRRIEIGSKKVKSGFKTPFRFLSADAVEQSLAVLYFQGGA